MAPESSACTPAETAQHADLYCPLGRPCTLARHHRIDSLVTCVQPRARACAKQVVFGPDAFCVLWFSAAAPGNGFFPKSG